MDKTNIEKYTKTFGCRYSKAQKQKFIQALQEDMGNLGYESEEIKGKHFLSRSHSYLFGNCKQIKTLVVVPYDTPEKKFWNKVIYFPMNGTRTASKTMLATYIPILVLFIVVFVGVYVIQPMMSSRTTAALMSLVLFVLTMGLIYVMLHGVHNKNNYNRNSASIVSALELAQSLHKDERKQVGFLFTDKNKGNFLGAESCMKYLSEKGKSPNMICMDCIANGSQLKIGYTPQNRKLAAEVAKYCADKQMDIECVKLNDDMRLQSAMTFYKKAVLVSCGEVDEENHLYVMGTGTSKDTLLHEERMELVKDMILKYLQAQK